MSGGRRGIAGRVCLKKNQGILFGALRSVKC